jgi:cytochrome d ubiquinol oxidase subunit I
MGISSYYILRGRDLGFARRSFAVAVGFGFASILSVMVLGDESGYTVGHAQRTKLAVIEAEYETQPAPAAFTVFGIPNEETMEVEHAVRIPWALGLIATRSIDKPVMGIRDIVVENEARIIEGVKAYGYMQSIRAGDKSPALRARFEEVKKDLGYGLLLKRYIENPTEATPELIKKAARDAIPRVTPMFWSFRLMVGIGVYMLGMITIGFYYTIRRQLDQKRWYLHVMMWSIPAPWIAIELGWFVAEYGRQPWAINDVLPTFLAVSSLTTADLLFSIAAFFLLYTAFLGIEMWLMFKFIRKGPSSLKTGRFHFEKKDIRPAYPGVE